MATYTRWELLEPGTSWFSINAPLLAPRIVDQIEASAKLSSVVPDVPGVKMEFNSLISG